MIREAIVLAGGMGTRLRAEVPDLPKPMAPVDGRPFLEYLLEYWMEQGVSGFVLSVGYRHDAIIAHFGHRFRDATIDYAIESEPLGTGGALMLAARKLRQAGRFLLLNGDTFFAADAGALRTFADTHDADWCLSVFRSEDTARYLGMTLTEQGRITALRASQGHQAMRVNGGAYCVHQRALAGPAQHLGSRFSLETELLPAAQSLGQRLFALESAGAFIDIGIPSDYRRAAAVIRGGRVPVHTDTVIESKGDHRNA